MGVCNGIWNTRQHPHHQCFWNPLLCTFWGPKWLPVLSKFTWSKQVFNFLVVCFFLVSDHNRKTKMVTWTEFLSTQQSSVLWTCCTFHFNCYTSGIVTPFERNIEEIQKKFTPQNFHIWISESRNLSFLRNRNSRIYNSHENIQFPVSC